MNTTKKIGVTTCIVVIALVVLASNVTILSPAPSPEATPERSGWKLPPKTERLQKRSLKTELQIQRAYELAEQMGVARSDGISFHSEGHVPTHIDGRPVPMHLLTEEEQTRVEAARGLKKAMDSIDNGGSGSPITLESMPIDTSIY